MTHPDCPDAEKLASLALGELSGDERDAIADHAVACAACSRTLRDLFDLDRAVAEARGTRRRRVSAGWWMAAAAALLVGGAALTITTWRVNSDRSLSPMVERGGGDEAIGAIPPDNATLPAAPASLSCPSHPEAERYWVALFDAESTLIWESPKSDSPIVTIPEEVRARLGAGRYLWQCLRLHGIETERSPLLRFEIAGAAR